ncbi:MAG: hypothetical protein FJ125_15980, partial [Deltaproteobacteria bacterium]|nr:hypothetical protein [Deltaproteobacteria bacterium]
MQEAVVLPVLRCYGGLGLRSRWREGQRSRRRGSGGAGGKARVDEVKAQRSARPASGSGGNGLLTVAWSFALLQVAAALPLAGCNHEEPVMVVRTRDPSRHLVGSFGLVTLMQTERLEPGPCLKLSGQFVHYSRIHPEAVVRAIDPEIGRLPNEGVLGQCQEVRPEGRQLPRPGDAADEVPFMIELLDAGNLVVRHPIGTIGVEPQPFPDVLASVGGVVYGTPAGECIPLSGEGEIAVQGDGGPDVGTFSVVLPLPRQPEISAVDGIPPENGQISLGHPLEGPLIVQWQRPE